MPLSDKANIKKSENADSNRQSVFAKACPLLQTRIMAKGTE
jgi:hypothetical protein